MQSEKIELSGYICGPKIYEYENYLFEYGGYTGPWPIRKKDYAPFERAGKKFYEMVDRFMQEPDPEKFRIGGGCQRF